MSDEEKVNRVLAGLSHTGYTTELERAEARFLIEKLYKENQQLKDEIYKSNVIADTNKELAESYYKDNQKLKEQLKQKEDIINKLKDLLDDEFLEVIDRDDLLKILDNKGETKWKK